jgi:hypothetical protein
MVRQGYGAPFAAALTASASTIGPIFPPSIPIGPAWWWPALGGAARTPGMPTWMP